jgi:hypothetical protein
MLRRKTRSGPKAAAEALRLADEHRLKLSMISFLVHFTAFSTRSREGSCVRRFYLRFIVRAGDHKKYDKRRWAERFY